MIFVYILQFLVHAFTDTRKSGFQMLINMVFLWGSVILTVMNYGWLFIWVPFVILLLSGLFGGVAAGLISRISRSIRADNAYGVDNPFLSLSSPNKAIAVSDIREEREYLEVNLDGYDYEMIGVDTVELEGIPYDIQHVQDNTTGDQYDFYFDVTEAIENAEVNLNSRLSDREAIDKAAVIDWLKEENYKNIEKVWEKSYAKTTEAYDLLTVKGTITEALLQKQLGVSKAVASAIIFRFRFRGWME